MQAKSECQFAYYPTLVNMQAENKCQFILSISMQAKNECYNSHTTNITVSSMQYKNESQNSHTIHIQYAEQK